MRKLLILFSVSLAASMLYAQKQADRYAEITNPKLQYINREEPRSTFYSFTNMKEALDAHTPPKEARWCC